MDAAELTAWLGSDESAGAGWSKADGSGESIGHDSGRKIADILERSEAGEEVTDDDVDHMRRVVAYCKRHLAQEATAKKDPHSKSAKSLKNWGHDPSKTA